MTQNGPELEKTNRNYFECATMIRTDNIVTYFKYIYVIFKLMAEGI